MNKKPNSTASRQTTLAPFLSGQVDALSSKHPDLISLDTLPLYNELDSSVDSAYFHHCRFYTDKVVIYRDYLESRSRSQLQVDNNVNLSRGVYNGWISKNARRKIRVNLEGWIKSIEVNRKRSRSLYSPKHAHVTFLTLTLCADQIHSDNELKRSALMPFIQRLQRELGVCEYFWKMEPQRNGRAHFHLLIDRYIDKDLLQNYWNMSLEHMGYLSRYFEESGSLFPPSTDIRQAPDDMSLVTYLMKYVTKSPYQLLSCRPSANGKVVRKSFWYNDLKQDGSIEVVEWRKMEGRVWGMSKGLKDFEPYNATEDGRTAYFLSTLEFDPEVIVKHDEYFSIYYCNVQSKMLAYDRTLFFRYEQFYLDQYRSNYHRAPTLAPPLVVVHPPPDPPKRSIYEMSQDQLKLAV